MKEMISCAVLNSSFESEGSVQNCPNSLLDSNGTYFCKQINLTECPLDAHIEAILKDAQSKQEVPADPDSIEYTCRYTRTTFRHSKEDIGAYKVLNCPHARPEDAGLVQCSKLEGWCEVVHPSPKSKTKESFSDRFEQGDHGPFGKHPNRKDDGRAHPNIKY